MRAGLRGWAHSYRQQFFSWALTGLELVWREMERGWGGGIRGTAAVPGYRSASTLGVIRKAGQKSCLRK